MADNLKRKFALVDKTFGEVTDEVVADKPNALNVPPSVAAAIDGETRSAGHAACLRTLSEKLAA